MDTTHTTLKTKHANMPPLNFIMQSDLLQILNNRQLSEGMDRTTLRPNMGKVDTFHNDMVHVRGKGALARNTSRLGLVENKIKLN